MNFYYRMRLLVFLSLTILVSSCEYMNNLTAESEEITREINCGHIKYIIVDSPCKIELLPESSEVIMIDGYKHLVDDLQLTFGKDSLTINHKKKYFQQKNKLITLRIPANDLRLIRTFAVCEMETIGTITPDNLKIVINGVSKFTNAKLMVENNNFLLHVYGTGNIGHYQVEGRSKKASFLLEGCVSIDASNFSCENVKVNHKSIKECYVNTSQSLQVTIYSTGDTFYSGNPTLEFKHVVVPYFSSSGDVIKIDE